MSYRANEFREALASIPWIAERIAAGQQFNCYESADNDEDDDPFDMRFALCIGSISDHRFICPIIGQDRARLIEAALKLAAETAIPRPEREATNTAGVFRHRRGR